MPVVPTYQPQVREQAVPGARVSVDAPIESFGGGQAAQQATQATAGVAEVAGKFAFQEKQKADDLATQDAWNKTVTLRQNLMMNPQTGAMTKKGKDAFGVIDEYGGQFQKETQKIEESLSNEDQRAMYRKMRTHEMANLNESLQKHLFQESEHFDNETTQATISNATNDAVLYYGDPNLRGQAMNKIALAWQSKGQRSGWTPDMIEAATNKSLSAAHREVINRMVLNGQDQAAQDYYKDIQKSAAEGKPGFKFDAADAVAVDRVIEQGETVRLGNEAYNKVSGYKLADGQPNEAKMRAEIYADTSLSPERKEKIWSYVKTRSSEDMANKTRYETAQDHKFMNDMIAFRKQGGSLDDALRQASAQQRDAYDGVLKAQIVSKIYAPPTSGDPAVYVALHDKILAGNANQQEIDRAYTQDHSITDKQWETLRSAYVSNVVEGQNPAMKQAWEQVKILAREKIGSNKDKTAQFMSVMHEDAKGKSPDEIVKMANDKFKDAPGTGWLWDDPQWKVDVKRLNAKSLAFGAAHADLGSDVVDAIGQGVTMKGAKSFTPADLNSFGQALGGYDAIKKGTPANNAIQSLIRHKKPVTVANIQYILAQKPDGKF